MDWRLGMATLRLSLLPISINPLSHMHAYHTNHTLSDAHWPSIELVWQDLFTSTVAPMLILTSFSIWIPAVACRTSKLTLLKRCFWTGQWFGLFGQRQQISCSKSWAKFHIVPLAGEHAPYFWLAIGCLIQENHVALVTLFCSIRFSLLSHTPAVIVCHEHVM